MKPVREPFQPFGPGTRVFRDPMHFITEYSRFLTDGPFSTVAQRFAKHCGTTPEILVKYMEATRKRLNAHLARRTQRKQPRGIRKKPTPRRRPKS